MTQTLLERLDATNPSEILYEQSETFARAAAFLSESDVRKLSSLYAVCRKIDNLADEAQRHQDPAQELRELKQFLVQHENANRTVELYSGSELRPTPLIHLIEGVQFDLNRVRISTLDELLEYCYRVAGTVGLMIANLYNLPETAEPKAISLGIGMQLTNIARDVQEDYGMNRIYVPSEWIEHEKFAEAIESGTDPELIRTQREKLLGVAKHYYRYADQGWNYLPWSVRPALYIAGVCYRSLGRSIRKRMAPRDEPKPSLSFLAITITFLQSLFEWLRRSVAGQQTDPDELRDQIETARNGSRLVDSEVA